MRFLYSTIVGYMLAGMILLDIANREIGTLDPILDQLPRVVGRPIIDHKPFEIAQRLRAKTVEHPMQRVRTIVGRSEHGK